MKRLYQARDRIEAQFLHDFLTQHRVTSVVLGDLLSGAFGELPADITPTLWVLDDWAFERAQELLARFLADTAPLDPVDGTTADWTCPACGAPIDGGFECCWNCARVRGDR